MIPDAERIVGKWVRDDTAVAALGARVAGRTPANMTAPWVKLTQMDAADVGEGLEHLIEYMLQLDCYAGEQAMAEHTGQAEANTLATTVRDAIKALEGQVYESVVCSRVRFVSMPRIVDTDFEPARERFVLTAEVVLHP